jgi:hypothetical protein
MREPSATVARVVTRGSFVPVFVVASDASHQLLCLCIKALFQFVREVDGLPTAKRCSNATMMQDLDVTVLPRPMTKAEISFEGLLHRDLALDLRPNV